MNPNITAQGIDELQTFIETQHGGTATFFESVNVTETWQRKTVWKGPVNVFELDGHPTAKRAYAWSELVSGSDNTHYYTELHEAPINSAKAAVRASIVYRSRL